MKDIYSCLCFDNQAEAVGTLSVKALRSDPNKKKTNRLTKALLQLGDRQGVQNAVVT